MLHIYFCYKIIYGTYMNYIWNIYNLYREHIWNIYGTYMKCVSRVRSVALTNKSIWHRCFPSFIGDIFSNKTLFPVSLAWNLLRSVILKFAPLCFFLFFLHGSPLMSCVFFHSSPTHSAWISQRWRGWWVFPKCEPLIAVPLRSQSFKLFMDRFHCLNQTSENNYDSFI